MLIEGSIDKVQSGTKIANETAIALNKIVEGIDRFGEKIIIQASDDETFTAIVKATTGGMRLWAIHYIENCKVISPKWLVDDVKNAIRKGMAAYEIND